MGKTIETNASRRQNVTEIKDYVIGSRTRKHSEIATEGAVSATGENVHPITRW